MQKIIEEQQKLGGYLLASDCLPAAEDKQLHSCADQDPDASTESLSPRKKQKVIDVGTDGSAPSLAEPEANKKLNLDQWDRDLYDNDIPRSESQ